MNTKIINKTKLNIKEFQSKIIYIKYTKGSTGVNEVICMSTQ